MFKNKRTYLDWASGAPVSLGAQKVFKETLEVYGNPSSPHKEGVAARELLETARTTIARLTEVKSDGVIFTSGATEANNLALTGSVMALKEKFPAEDMHILHAPSAHASVTETLAALSKRGVVIEPFVIRDGKIDLARLQAQLRPETRLVSMDVVCGETGTRWDTRGVRNVLNDYLREQKSEKKIMLHVDASQAPLAMPYDLTRLSADMVTIDAQKVGGIRGVGALCMRTHVKLSRVLHGGGQERGLRPGTEPVSLVAAFAAALEEVEKNRNDFVVRAVRMRESLVSAISQEVPTVLVNVGKEFVPHILNLSFPGRDTDYLIMLLDREGFAIATKSACEADSEQGSRAVAALTSDEERARSTLRISWGPGTSERDIHRFANALTSAVRFLDASFE